MCRLTSSETLDLQMNRLSGTIPDCLGRFSSFTFLGLSSNKLSGKIPCFGSDHSENSLAFLHLNDNILSGRIPSCLGNFTRFLVLDVGENELTGKVPSWITGEEVLDLQILRLRGNKLSGVIPHQLCSLSNLQILDLGHNHFTGSISNCLSNLTAMNFPQLEDLRGEFTDRDKVSEVIQGIEHAYKTTLGYLVNIDLSCNELVGSIPDGITNLSYLLNLNLSYNQLSGMILDNIGDLKSLVSLDFSINKLWGTIPTSMGELYGLGFLNLSYNNFSGQIPTGNQMQTLINPSFYAENPYLCGDFLSKKCKSNNDSPNGSRGQDNQVEEEDEYKYETMWFYLVVMSDFATGFWSVVGILLLKKSWRHALFRRVEKAQDWLYLYVTFIVNMAKLKKK